MPLAAYGLLIGTPIASRPQSGGHPHWLVMVQPGIANHPPYRVAVNLESTAPDAPPEIDYQIIDVAAHGGPALRALVDRLRATRHGPADSFQTGPGTPSLDFVRGGLFMPDQTFQPVAEGEKPLKTAFERALVAAIQAGEADGGRIAVFGTGYPIKTGTSRSPSTGYTGIDNIHMNQGSPNRVGAGNHYLENGPNQDGGLILFGPTSATAFFVKFKTQTLDTDADGNPKLSGHPAIDPHLDTVRAAIRTAPAVTEALSAPPPRADTPAGYVFADPADDAIAAFEPDTDTFFKTDYVQTIAHGQKRTEVPDPRDGVPVFMDLADIVGPAIPGHTAGPQESLQFDMIGDSGAVTAAKLQGSMSVGELMTALAAQSPPAFLYHVGDVVYYYGEKRYYYGQFAEVFKGYPAPIFAIPGNHDALTYDASMVPLESFKAAFCAAEPSVWDGFGGIRRTTMTQPGVYFTLDAPLVSIIGLYSNAGESGGWLNDKQYAFLLGELQRLKAKRTARERAIILAIHHLPKWFPTEKKDPTSAALDAVFAEAGLWPDAVVCGHAHLYQRAVRQKGVGGAPADIPYFVNGNGGYGIVATQVSGGHYFKDLPAALRAVVNEEGFLRVTATRTAAGGIDLTFDCYSAKRGEGKPPADSYSVTI